MILTTILTGCTSGKEVTLPETDGDEQKTESSVPEETADNKGEEADDNKTEDTTLVFWSIGLKLKDDSGIKMPEELAANRFIAKFEEVALRRRRGR